MSGMTANLIIRPVFLWLLLLLPMLLVPLRRSLAGMSRGQRAASTALRALVLLLFILALAGVRFPWQSRELAVVFAFDRSASVTPEAEKAGRAFLSQVM